MRGELGFSGEEGEGSEDQSQRRKTRGKKIEREGGEQDEDDADRARDDCAGMVEFDVESKRANGEKQKRDVRVHEVVEDVLLESHVKRNDGLACEF